METQTCHFTGIAGLMRKWNTAEHCPNCGSNNGNIWDYDVSCCNCDWWGKFLDLVTEEEWINKTRWEKLNIILNG